MTEEKHGEIRLPRAVRLCRKYEFSQNETDMILLTVAMQAGFEQEDGYCCSDNEYNALSLCSFLDLPLHEVLDFLDQDRLHMQQGLFPSVERDYILSSGLRYETEVCRVLMGASLKQNDFLMIEQTYLADIVAQEPEYQHFCGDNESKKPEATTDQEG